MVVAIVSWPGLARSSTTLPPPVPPVVDGRHKAGHDTMGTPSCCFDAHAGMSRPSALRRPVGGWAGTLPAMTVREPPGQSRFYPDLARPAAYGDTHPSPRHEAKIQRRRRIHQISRRLDADTTRR